MMVLAWKRYRKKSKKGVSFVFSLADGYSQAVAVVLRDGKASTSYIQCRLSIEYNYVTTWMERIEEEGIISLVQCRWTWGFIVRWGFVVSKNR